MTRTRCSHFIFLTRAETAIIKHFIVLLFLIIGLPNKAWAPFEYRHAIDDPLGRQSSRVFNVYGEYSVRGVKVHLPSVRRMFNTGVKQMAGTDDLSAAWREFIHDDDIVALKFTQIGAKGLGTNRDVAAALLQSLYEAGFKPENFMLVGLEDLPDEAEGTIPYRYGWQEQPVDFGSDTDHLPLWLNDVTAIINIPSIMDDNIIGLHAALANLTLPIVKSPAKLYEHMIMGRGNMGDPFIPEIYELPQIRGKVRLHIANSLRILYYGGPRVKQTYVHERGELIFSTDPVALDKVALELLKTARRDLMMPPNVDINIRAPYLKTAQAMGLGYYDLNFIEYKRIPHEDY
ncbi:MAG: hypothetical protein JW860_08815 [Sedimentisphaerales bacterium]|nr:hypothetical protein [Sedimentisphaerales bacterium]